MRLYQQFRASIARSAILGAVALLFVSGMPVSAFGQAPQAGRSADRRAGAAATGRPAGTPLAIEEAVRMALENNLGIQVEKLNPQIQVLGIARGPCAYAPTLFSTASRGGASTSPPTRLHYLRRRPGDLDQLELRTPTAACSSTAVVRQQLLRSCSTGRGRRRTTINPRVQPAARLRTSTRQSPSRCCGTSRSTRSASSCCWPRTSAAADIQLQQRITQTARNVRAAYYPLIGAIAGLEVAQQSLDVAHVAQEQPDPRRSRHDGADRHRDRGGGSREQRGER